jgi:hypothetical protein
LNISSLRAVAVVVAAIPLLVEVLSISLAVAVVERVDTLPQVVSQ